MGLVVITEIAFLGRLDVAKNVDLVNSWADSFYQSTTSPSSSTSSTTTTSATTKHIHEGDDEDEADAGLTSLTCEEWLEKEDSVAYSRDFHKVPIFVTGAEQEWKSCPVGCNFGFDANRKPDAAFGLPRQDGAASVLRSMESAQYYSENNIAMARRWEGI